MKSFQLRILRFLVASFTFQMSNDIDLCSRDSSKNRAKTENTMAARRGRMSMAVVLVIAVAALFQGTAEAATYVVGDAMGWTVPADDDAYENWAAGKNFTVGDVLVFNFTTGAHDVAQVSEQGEDDCAGANPIRQATTGPASMTLTTAGKNYFICTIGGHCNAGQKLDINVLEGARTAPPPPRTPSPTPTPTPTTPTTSPAPAAPRKAVTYVVGDAMGWVVPPGNSDDTYEAWAFGKSFYVGDVLVFNFTTGSHDVAQVTEQAADDCNGANPIRKATAGPANMTLTTAGRNYFICTFGGHCDAGQELKINVLAAPLAPATPPPAMSPAPTPEAATPSPALAPAPTSTPSTPAPSSSATPPATATGPSANSPSGSAGGSTTPSSSSATSVGVAGVFTALLAVAVALMH